jgi:hypothetical protein
MGYRDDFYIKENIIGYTGFLCNKASVYFKKTLPSGEIEYGHITQYHEDPNNIGRGKVHKAKHYEIRNTKGYDVKDYGAVAIPDKDKWHSTEIANGQNMHDSREPFTAINNPSVQVYVLSSAIYLFKDKKRKY